MFVLLTDQQAVTSDLVCPGCLMADQRGQPRWREGKLLCGRQLQSLNAEVNDQYECQMGFRLARIHSD